MSAASSESVNTPRFGNQAKLSMNGVIQRSTCHQTFQSPGSLEQSTISFTLIKIKEQLVTELALANTYVRDAKTGITYILFKYYEMAAYLMYRIPIYQPIPTFDIFVEDLSSQLKHELADLIKSDQKTYHYIVKMAVSHIFENINFEYFHSSVMRFLKVRFVSETKKGEPKN